GGVARRRREEGGAGGADQRLSAHWLGGLDWRAGAVCRHHRAAHGAVDRRRRSPTGSARRAALRGLVPRGVRSGGTHRVRAGRHAGRRGDGAHRRTVLLMAPVSKVPMTRRTLVALALVAAAAAVPG